MPTCMTDLLDLLFACPLQIEHRVQLLLETLGPRARKESIKTINKAFEDCPISTVKVSIPITLICPLSD